MKILSKLIGTGGALRPEQMANRHSAAFHAAYIGGGSLVPFARTVRRAAIAQAAFLTPKNERNPYLPGRGEASYKLARSLVFHGITHGASAASGGLPLYVPFTAALNARDSLLNQRDGRPMLRGASNYWKDLTGIGKNTFAPRRAGAPGTGPAFAGQIPMQRRYF